MTGEMMEWDGSCDLLNAGPVLFGPVITAFKYPSYCFGYGAAVKFLSSSLFVVSKGVAET